MKIENVSIIHYRDIAKELNISHWDILEEFFGGRIFDNYEGIRYDEDCIARAKAENNELEVRVYEFLRDTVGGEWCLVKVWHDWEGEYDEEFV